MHQQARLTDLIPMRLSTFALLAVVGLAIVLGLEALYGWMPVLADQTSDGRVAAFDLDGEGSLAVWFSSTTLLLAGCASVIVYSVRRYRIDDYQGRYRIWIWAAACCLLLSIDETASLHEGFKEMMSAVTGTRLFGDGSIWWVTAYFFLLAGVGTRVLIDVRHCRESAAALIATGACYALAVVTQLGWILPESGARGVMFEEGAEMVGNLLLLLSVGLFGRYVILDAEGLLPQHDEEDLEAEDEEEEEDIEPERPARQPWFGSKTTRTDRPHTTPKPAATSSTVEWNTPVKRKLTKAEKKALRKRLAQERLKRERQGKRSA